MKLGTTLEKDDSMVQSYYVDMTSTAVTKKTENVCCQCQHVMNIVHANNKYQI